MIMTNSHAGTDSRKVSSLRPSGLHEQYRAILSTANKLESILTKVESVIDLFVTPVVDSLYSKLCRDCLELLLKCDFKLEHFRKAEELLWKRIYYDFYKLIKTKRHFVAKQDEYLVESHFTSGIGFYSNLIIRLRLHHKIDNLPGALASLNLPLSPVEDFLESNKREDDDSLNCIRKDNNDGSNLIEASITTEDDAPKNKTTAQQWARQAIYRSMIYMGDLARYLLELSDFDNRKLAFELYRSASHYQPECGLPFNQLATLCGGKNYNLDAICNYMRCCSRPKPFQRAEGNLLKISELNKRHYEELVALGRQNLKASLVLASKDPVTEAEAIMRSTIITFIRFTSDLWTASENPDEEIMRRVINDNRLFRDILTEAMELEPIVPFSNSSSMEHGFCPISGGTSDQEKPRYVSPTIMYEFCSISLMLIARRRKMSDELDDIDKTIDALAMDILMYATLKCQELIMNKVQDLRIRGWTATISDDTSDLSSDIESIVQRGSSSLDLVESTYANIYRSTYLPTIKVFLDWLLSNTAIINSNVETFKILHASLNNIVDLFDEITRLTEISELELDADSTYRHIYTGPEWSQKFALSCDLPFVNLQPLRGAHEANIDFGLNIELDDSECGFVAVQCVTAFADALTIFLKNKCPART